MTKFLLSLIGFFLSIGIGILIMINGWGLHPVSWGWIIGGGVGGSILAALFQLSD